MTESELGVCDECGEDAVKKVKDAANITHRFCASCAATLSATIQQFKHIALGSVDNEEKSVTSD